MLSASALQILRAVAELGELEEGTYLGAAELAGRIGAPRNYLGKLLQGLARRGLVVGRKGQRGGFRLAGDPARLSLLEVLDPTQEVARVKGCLLGRSACREGRPCAAHASWARARGAYLRFLTETSVLDLMEHGGRDKTPAAVFRPHSGRGRALPVAGKEVPS